MIFERIKRKSIHFFIKKNEQKLLNKRQVKIENEIKEILIISDSIDSLSRLKNEISGLKEFKDKQISFVLFAKKQVVLNENFYTVSNKNIGWFGKLNLSDFPFDITKQYDLLINYSKVDNEYIKLLLLQLNSVFKIGLSQSDPNYYNLIINVNFDEIKKFVAESKKYLSILNLIK